MYRMFKFLSERKNFTAIVHFNLKQQNQKGSERIENVVLGFEFNV